MFSVAERALQPALAAAAHVTLAVPEPVAGENVSQAALLEGVQAHPLPALTVTVPLPPAAPGAALGAERVYVHAAAAPAWFTLKTCPPIVSDALRGVVLVLPATV